MLINKKDVPLVSLSWREGRYFDFWVFVHVLTGLFIGFLMAYLSAPFVVTVWLVCIGFSVYEVLEDVFGVHEVIENRVLDVVFGLLGFMSAYGAGYHFALSMGEIFWAGLTSGLAALALASLGWLAWMRRTNRIPFLNHKINTVHKLEQ